MDSIWGTFTVKSNKDGDWYEVTFKPDHEQIWSAQPKGWTAKFTGANCLREAEQCVGGPSPDKLRDARLNGSVQFTGKVSRAEYSKRAKF